MKVVPPCRTQGSRGTWVRTKTGARKGGGIANADVFPDLGSKWYEQGFKRVLGTLAATFQHLTDQELLRIDDALLAANHFAGLLLWIPVNQAMFTGSTQHNEADLDRYAAAGARVFLAAYRWPPSHPKRDGASRAV
ncbi:TetR/AcrR family transcriptional regulator C-terminal domain-containing protein [Streptomyces sp. YS415]|uniref:TetR/AcrR family transcriptional regulator C-terminal domain-containing protein n=1 Tax=Streptomyces sp. YS415 TaxID=2944806 RepID=UPI002020612B|nr:TetR/AcrR family transcriptional regulator C-terminal domain-containing protein [Streptomyces sp. YS415]MCL7425574.1 TetR/AcrR family transcriptional regulator C-terminal domain-containing protein [Streptomyces sp. YS415]